MLAKKNRLTKRQFNLTYERAKVYAGQNVQLRVWRNPDTEESDNATVKAAVSVPKRLCKQAAKRSWWRRRGYDAFESVIAEIKDPVWMIMVYTTLSDKNTAVVSLLEADINEVLVKAGVIEGSKES